MRVLYVDGYIRAPHRSMSIIVIACGSRCFALDFPLGTVCLFILEMFGHGAMWDYKQSVQGLRGILEGCKGAQGVSGLRIFSIPSVKKPERGDRDQEAASQKPS